MNNEGSSEHAQEAVWAAAEEYLASDRADRAESEALSDAVRKAVSAAGGTPSIYVAKLTTQGYRNQFWQGRGLSQQHDVMVACDQSGNVEGVCAEAKARLNPRADSGFEAVVIAAPQGRKWRLAAVVQAAHCAIGESVRQAIGNPHLPVMTVDNPLSHSTVSISSPGADAQAHLTPADILQHLGESPNIVLEGPPGTGKTFLAQQLLQHFAGSEWQRFKLDNFTTPSGELDAQRLVEAPIVWDMVQFHPSYSYEDFVEGLRTVADGNGVSFKIRHGSLPLIARAASLRPDKPTVLIIDELNRGNAGTTLGETLFAIDPAHRGRSIRVQYAGYGGSVCALSIPRSLWIIGTMNTADRSVALLDFALRRRFRFLPVTPSEQAVQSFYSQNTKRASVALDLFRRVSGTKVDRDLRPGHAYFMVRSSQHLTDADWAAALAGKLFNELRPLLREYAEEGLLSEPVRLPGAPEDVDLVRGSATEGRDSLILWIKQRLQAS
jgi:hypothetical protein